MCSNRAAGLQRSEKKSNTEELELKAPVQRHTERHVASLQEIWKVVHLKPECKRRGAAAQHRKREVERSLRVRVLAFSRWVRWHGHVQTYAAGKLDLNGGTLAAWQRGWAEDRLVIESRGRPTHDPDWETRQAIIALFNLVGPGVGLPCLRDCFPGESKGALEDLLQRYRRLHLRRNKVLLHVLHWQRAGTVWAMDFAQPPAPVDARYPFIFLVRDLASGNQLMALPVPSREIRHVIPALSALFEQYGPPLVLKSDNEFNTDRTLPDDEHTNRSELQKLAALLSEHGVVPLLSPPALPRYNAAIEAGIGSFKTRAHHEAARHGHPNEWNCDDVEAARLQANELARPWGHSADTPDSAWQQRHAIGPEARTRFLESVQQLEAEERQQRQLDYLPGLPLSRKDQAAVRRAAISRALVKHGLLLLRRRRFTLPLKRAIWSKIL